MNSFQLGQFHSIEDMIRFKDAYKNKRLGSFQQLHSDHLLFIGKVANARITYLLHASYSEALLTILLYMLQQLEINYFE